MCVLLTLFESLKRFACVLSKHVDSFKHKLVSEVFFVLGGYHHVGNLQIRGVFNCSQVFIEVQSLVNRLDATSRWRVKLYKCSSCTAFEQAFESVSRFKRQ